MRRSVIRVCFFPGRESSYARSRVLLRGLREAGLVVYDCSCPKRNCFRYFKGFVKFLRFNFTSDIIIVGFFGQCLVPLVRLFSRKKIIFDAYLSAYQTLVFDRKTIRPNGLKAAAVRFVERLSCRLADICLLDTNQHIDYFVNEYKLDRSKFRRSFVGAENSEPFDPKIGRMTDPIIHFHGEFQALHGAKFIIEAAKLLPEFRFRMIGSGRELDGCIGIAKMLKVGNVEFLPSMPFEMLLGHLANAAVCLGIFGESQKTQLVIPIKVYEALAMGKPVITADTPAVRELLTDKKDVFLCNAADPNDLAKAIRTLMQDDALRIKIATNGRETFMKMCTPKKIGEDIARMCEQLLTE